MLRGGPFFSWPQCIIRLSDIPIGCKRDKNSHASLIKMMDSLSWDTGLILVICNTNCNQEWHVVKTLKGNVPFTLEHDRVLETKER